MSLPGRRCGIIEPADSVGVRIQPEGKHVGSSTSPLLLLEPARGDRSPSVGHRRRLPAIFELRRLLSPKFESRSDAGEVDQSIGGFLDHIQKPNFAAFAKLAATETGREAVQIERVSDDGAEKRLDDELIGSADTIIVISFDSFRTDQKAAKEEIEAVKNFL